MSPWKLYVQVILGAACVIVGCEWLPQFVRPERALPWVGLLLIVFGLGLGLRTTYVARKGAVLLGSILLLGGALWAKNLPLYFDASRGSGTGPPLRFFVPPAVLILSGVGFSVVLRHLLSHQVASGATEQPVARTPSAAAHAAPKGATPAKSRRSRRGPMSLPLRRLLLVACSAVLAVLVGRFTGIDDAAHRSSIIIVVLVLGCLATGLISESTLTKLMPWKKE
jgi:hypothetical protein